jgi:murein DD-endopeptidase MepM/ murein hydrolase activator NlpD
VISAYAYAGDRPTVMVDPSGEVFAPSDEALDALGTAVTPADIVGVPIVIPEGGGGCAARPGYPLGAIGGFNGGRATHRAKHHRGASWQSTEAIDLNVPVGTPVCAIFDGRISPGAWPIGPTSEGFRLYLVGRSDIAFYTHMSRRLIHRVAKRRQTVKRGQLIGYSACGSERVPHLHLALMKGNPDRYARPFRRPINYGGCPG